MYTQDKIIKGGEITASGKFSINGFPFYLFISPKADTAASTIVVNAKLAYNDAPTDFPLISGVWNPVVLNEVEISEENLSDYRIFWGQEGI